MAGSMRWAGGRRLAAAGGGRRAASARPDRRLAGRPVASQGVCVSSPCYWGVMVEALNFLLLMRQQSLRPEEVTFVAAVRSCEKGHRRGHLVKLYRWIAVDLACGSFTLEALNGIFMCAIMEAL